MVGVFALTPLGQSPATLLLIAGAAVMLGWLGVLWWKGSRGE